MLIKSYLRAGVYALIFIPSVSTAMTHSDLAKKYNTAIVQHTVDDGVTKDIISYLRKGSDKAVSDANGDIDYVYLWNGYNQDVYDLINITGMAERSEKKEDWMYFTGVNADKFDYDSEALNNKTILSRTRVVKNWFGAKKEVSLGYDTGVAPAFEFGCENNIRNIVLSSGGLYTKSKCKPHNTKVMYLVSDGDSFFPIDSDKTFIEKKGRYSLDGRVGGSESINILKKSLSCKTDGLMNVVENGGSDMSYTCGDGNELEVVTYRDVDHQWFGYKYASEGMLNQHGEPSSMSVGDWMSDIMSIN